MSESDERTKKEAAKDIRDSVEFRTDMIKTQQEALVKTMKRYEQRDNPVEQAFETVTVKLVDAFLTANERIVNALPNDTRLRLQKTWQDIMLAF